MNLNGSSKHSLSENHSSDLINVVNDLNSILKALDSFAIISKTDLRGVITHANKKFCDISKFSESELIGKPHSVIRSPEMPKEVFKEMWASIKKGKSWTGEIQNRAKDGTSYWVYSLVFPVAEKSKSPDQYMSIRFDITPLKQANQRQAILLEKLNAANQELVDFAYHVSHDLKSPLNGIERSLAMVTADISAQISPSHKATLELVIARVKRLEHLINSLLDLGRVGVVSGQIEELDLNKIIADVIDLLCVSREGIKFSLPANSIVLRGEPVKFHQLFQNLISNAVKFIGDKGGEVEIGTRTHNNEFQIYVRDTGPGIKVKDRKRIFDMFVTVAPPTVEHHNTGIGLAIVKKIIERYAGKIWIEPTKPHGATFVFTLPNAIHPVVN